MVVANIMICLYAARFGSCTDASSSSVCQLDGLCPRTPEIKAGSMKVYVEHTEDVESPSRRPLEALPVEAPVCTALTDQCSAFRYLMNE